MTPRNLIAVVLLLSAFGQPVFAADLVNINTADSATLQTLNGIGPSKAQGIIDYRTQHGPFATIADIQNVSGIGPTTYANIKDFITVGGASTQTQTTDQLNRKISRPPLRSRRRKRKHRAVPGRRPLAGKSLAMVPPLSEQVRIFRERRLAKTPSRSQERAMSGISAMAQLQKVSKCGTPTHTRAHTKSCSA
jgi:competence ComEA-like helix-hairpin-helix protein